MEKLNRVVTSRGDEVSQEEVAGMEREIDRVIKMFYLHMRVNGLIKHQKEDYFV
jgi:hypothetical protein